MYYQDTFDVHVCTAGIVLHFVDISDCIEVLLLRQDTLIPLVVAGVVAFAGPVLMAGPVMASPMLVAGPVLLAGPLLVRRLAMKFPLWILKS